jgi:hypothetical protein
MASFGTLQPDVAAEFRDAFDEAVGLDPGSEDQDGLLPPLKHKQGGCNIPPEHLGWACRLARGITFYPICTQVESGEMEPHPRGAIADFLRLQMMYVSGETGEPSVETTGIIEDIVRQQVIEIVGRPVER